jgi:hypothetical protein
MEEENQGIATVAGREEVVGQVVGRRPQIVRLDALRHRER